VTDRPDPDPDRALVAQASAGSREAFDELITRHQARIFNLARTLVGDDGEAEDLAQDTFVRAWRAIGRFRGDSAFGTWLYRVAINVIRSHLARRARWRLVWGWWPEEGTPTPPDVPDGVDYEADVARRDVIDRALAELPPDQRVAVTLRDVEGFDYREIADLLGVPIGTVMSRIFRGRARLKPRLAPLVGRPGRPR
jgi:RNA polymerase sigma-70 factor (ECF subfamily)